MIKNIGCFIIEFKDEYEIIISYNSQIVEYVSDWLFPLDILFKFIDYCGEYDEQNLFANRTVSKEIEKLEKIIVTLQNPIKSKEDFYDYFEQIYEKYIAQLVTLVESYSIDVIIGVIKITIDIETSTNRKRIYLILQKGIKPHIKDSDGNFFPIIEKVTNCLHDEIEIKNINIDNSIDFNWCDFVCDNYKADEIIEHLTTIYDKEIKPFIIPSLKDIIKEKFVKTEINQCTHFLHGDGDCQVMSDNRWKFKKCMIKKTTDLNFSMLACANKDTNIIKFALTLLDN